MNKIGRNHILNCLMIIDGSFLSNLPEEWMQVLNPLSHSIKLRESLK